MAGRILESTVISVLFLSLAFVVNRTGVMERPLPEWDSSHAKVLGPDAQPEPIGHREGRRHIAERAGDEHGGSVRAAWADGGASGGL